MLINRLQPNSWSPLQGARGKNYGEPHSRAQKMFPFLHLLKTWKQNGNNIAKRLNETYKKNIMNELKHAHFNIT